MKRDYEPICGTKIEDAADTLVALAKERCCTVTCAFNEVELSASATTIAADILKHFHSVMEANAAEARKKHEAWLQTAEGRESQRRSEVKKRALEADLAGGLKTFDVADKDAWDAEANADDGYGACCLRYAARWAHTMESAMADGATVKACAKQCSHDADIEGITGFMYGCAVQSLSRAWRHGEELRRWHNLDTQIGTEGEKANETGGSLNPALLSIG